MKTYNNIEEVKADIVDRVLKVDDDIEIAFDGFDIDANLICENIYSKDGKRNINAGDINAWNINAGDINAGNINAGNINAGDINAGDINAGNINAWNINAGEISYQAVCFAYQNITCNNIKGRRDNSKHFCLDGEITIKSKEDEEVEKAIKLLEEKGRLKDGKILN